MSNNFNNKIITDIQKYSDKIILNPLSSNEITQLEFKLNLALPSDFKAILMVIGLKQDLFNDFLTSEQELLSEKEFLYNLLGEKSNNFFAFAKDEFGNLLLLSSDIHSKNFIYKLDHTNAKVNKTKKTLNDYYNSGIVKLKKEYKRRRVNIEKEWKVEITLLRIDDKKLFELLRKNFEFNEVSNVWSKENMANLANIFSYEVEINDYKGKIMKYQYDKSDFNRYVIHLSEKIFENKKLILSFINLLKKLDIEHEVVDYGIF